MFYKIIKLSDLPLGQSKCLKLAGRKITLAHLKDGFFAVDDVCPHRGGQLCDGTVDLENNKIVCPLHSWDFDLKTGVSPYNPEDKVETFKTKEKDGYIWIEVTKEKGGALPDGYLDDWKRAHDDIEQGMETIHKMAKGWIAKDGQTDPMRPPQQDSLWDKVVFLPAQLAKFPHLEEKKVNLKTIIGKSAKHPLQIDLPIYVSHMSFGALSKEAKIALAKGAARAGTLNCSGEGGMLPAEQEAAKYYIFEMATGYFGWQDDKNLEKADAVEIKIGQAAKAGLGGVLPGNKVTAEIAKVRGIDPGTAAVSPARFKDINDLKELKQRIADLKKRTGGKPVGIKFAAAHVEEDLKTALELEPDFITIDGRGGATGAAPMHVRDHVGVPTLYALDRARRFLDKQGSDIDLIITGGLRVPEDFAKAIAMGATAVAIASSAMIAIGCQQYRACHTNKCPVGIATQDPKLRERFDIDQSAERLFNFFTATKYQLQDFTRILGHEDIHDLSPADLATLDSDIASHTLLKHVGQAV